MASQGTQQYRVRNWAEYNKSLVQRGSLTIWLEEETLKNWYADVSAPKRGRPWKYSAVAIECVLSIQTFFKVPLRAVQGLMQSLLSRLECGFMAPDYTTLCRRRKTLSVALNSTPALEAQHLVIDSTGLKVYGEGEWKTRQHGASKRRTWVKMHLAIDSATHLIVAATTTTHDVADCEELPALLEQVAGPVKQVTADGAYDTQDCHKRILESGAVACIPPRRNAVIKQHGNCKAPPLPRDEILRCIKKQGRRDWKKESGYHQRSLAETCMGRMKQIFGGRVSARNFDSQSNEIFLRCNVLNKLTRLGMPDSYLVT